MEYVSKGVVIMPSISIEKYQDKYFEEMLSLLVSSFESKFCHRQSLTPDDIKNILYTTWNINAEDTGYLHFVAKEGERIVGAILVKCGKTEKSSKGFPVFSLCRRYGFLNILLLTFKLSVLEIFKPKDCYIEHIAVDQSMRGNGIGGLLISHSGRILKETGFSTLSLAVAKSNLAKHLYDRNGFKDVDYINSRVKGYFIGINQWVLMRKNLK
jgi:ribosomal protein S18 acetylase RimI-like enzyme